MKKRQITTALLVLMLLVSFGACKGSESDGEPRDKMELEAGMPQSSSDPDLSAGDNIGDADNGENASGQDISGFVDKEDWKPLFPMYEDSIVWTPIPKEYIGGLGAWVEPDPENESFVNIRENPSISANVVAELHSGEEINWWIKNEFYKDGDQLFAGSYQVASDNYTWMPVTYDDYENNIHLKGWVAQEVVTIVAI